MGRSTPSQTQARAGPSRYRASRAPRASQPSQSQRPGRRGQPQPDEDDDDLYEKDDDNEEGDTDGDGEGGDGGDGDSMDIDEVDENSDLARKAYALVRLALFTEYKRAPLRREEISKKVLGGTPRAFAAVLTLAQKKLRDTFGMELVELATRAGVEAMERDAGVGVAGEAGGEQDKDAGTQANAKGKGKKKAETQATGLKKKAQALTTKTYVLRSVLPAVLIEHAAQTDGELYEAEMRDTQSLFPVYRRRRTDGDAADEEDRGNARAAGGSQAQRAGPRRGHRGARGRNAVQSSSEDEDDDNAGADGHDNEAQSRAPMNYGSIISWSRSDQLSALGVLYVVLALVLAHNRVLEDAKLRAYMRTLRIPSTPTAHPIPLTTLSTSPTLAMSLDDFLTQMLKQGYLYRAVVGGDAAGGSKKAGGGGGGAGRGAKRVRGGQDAGGGGAGDGQYEWRWGARAFVEVGEERVGRFVAEFMVSANADNADEGAGEDTDTEEEGGARGGEKTRKKKRDAVEKMIKGFEKAAGGKFLC